MSSPRRLIPPTHADLTNWPAPVAESLSEGDRNLYIRRRVAVEMYHEGADWSEIHSRAKLRPHEVRRQVKRCVTPVIGQKILGFYGLVPRLRVAKEKYRRSAPVHHVPGIPMGGAAGALGQVLARFDGLEDDLEVLITKGRTADSIPSACNTWVDIASVFRGWLKAEGLGPYDWPFNTRDLGVEAIRRWAIRRAGQGDATRYVQGRYGLESARRGQIGGGETRTFPSLRPFAMVQMDYIKIDAASIVVLKHPLDGSDVEVPLSRWYLGLVVEESMRLIIGAHVILEVNPSAESVAATLASVHLGPHFAVSGGSGEPTKLVLPVQLLPELEGMCFAGIKLDNAWANAAIIPMDVLIDTMGAAVNFGPVQAWWRRAAIERVNEEVTRRGPQKIVSSYGKRPNDPHSHRPVEAAIHHRILQSQLEDLVFDVIAEINALPSTAMLGLSPIKRLEHAMTNPASGFVFQKLPRDDIRAQRTAYVREDCRVAGSLKKHVRPYIESMGIRWTSPELANRYNLLGSTIECFFHLFDSARAFAVVKGTGEDLGPLVPPSAWRDLHLFRRDVRLIHRWAGGERRRMDDKNIAMDFAETKKREVIERRQKQGKKAKLSQDALGATRMARSMTTRTNRAVNDTPNPNNSDEKMGRDPFGLR